MYKPIKEDTACAYIQRGIGIIQNVRKKTLITEVGVIKHKMTKRVAYQTLLQDLVKLVKTTGENVLLFIAISLEHK